MNRQLLAIARTVSQAKLWILRWVSTNDRKGRHIKREGRSQPHGISGMGSHGSLVQGVEQDRQGASVVHHEAQHVRQEFPGYPHFKAPHWVRTHGLYVEIRNFCIV